MERRGEEEEEEEESERVENDRRKKHTSAVKLKFVIVGLANGDLRIKRLEVLLELNEARGGSILTSNGKNEVILGIMVRLVHARVRGLVRNTADSNVDTLSLRVACIEREGDGAAVGNVESADNRIGVTRARGTLHDTTEDEINLKGIGRLDGDGRSGVLSSRDSELEGTSERLDTVDLSLTFCDDVTDGILGTNEVVVANGGIPDASVNSVRDELFEPEVIMTLHAKNADVDTIRELSKLTGIELDGAGLLIILILSDNTGLEVRSAAIGSTCVRGGRDVEDGIGRGRADGVNVDVQVNPVTLSGELRSGKMVLTIGTKVSLSGGSHVGNELRGSLLLEDSRDGELNGFLLISDGDRLHTNKPRVGLEANKGAVRNAKMATDVGSASLGEVAYEMRRMKQRINRDGIPHSWKGRPL